MKQKILFTCNMKRNLSIILMMKRILPILLLLAAAFVSMPRSVFSQNIVLPMAKHTVTVEATIGQFLFNISGQISPNASIVLIIDGVTARATVADANGYFSISGVLIKEGFSHFCLDAIDFKRLGESYTCFDIPPAQQSVTMKDIFLPPTLGLSRNVIAEGASVTAYGYSMPGALVTLYLSNGRVLTTYADKTGYYQFVIKDLKAGTYSLYTKATLNHKDSLLPTKRLQLKSLSWWDQLIAFLKDLWDKFLKFLRDLALGPLWLIIPILISIIILLVKLMPGKFGFLRNPFGKKHPLHHKWWMGY